MTTELNKYQKLSELEHITARPGIYIGSVSNTVQNSWVVNKDKMQDVEVAYNPGILKLFDEILSNSVDEHLRSGKVKTIWVETSPMTGYITVKDDGGIPVIRHPEYNTYIPEMIFGELRTGSNFDDDERITAGTNGLGSKLTSVFSVEFKVDTCDGKNRFVQVFRNNLSEKGKAVIQPNTDAGTTITFLPDYKRFGCSLDEGNLKKIERRVYDVAGCNPSIKVYYNGKHIKIAKVADYGAMFSDEFVFDTPTNDFTVGVSPSVGDGFQQVSFVNGIDTFNGGTHVTYVCDQITQKIRDYINKKYKVDVKPNTIKQQMFLFIRCTINAPSFTSQTKETMSSEVRNFGTSWSPSDKFIKKLIESSVVQKVLDWVEGEKRREELAQMRKLNNQTQNTNFLKRIVKFDDATSKDRSECTIFFTEGDSAAKTILSARNGKTHGVFPLKGKLINVREMPMKRLADNTEFQNIMSILGLKIGVKVNSLDELRFTRIVPLTDQDMDGQHISGLFFNMMNHFWPELFTLGAIFKMSTPLIVATVGKKEFEFFDELSYTKWAESNPKHTYKYFKGLGGFNTAHFKKFLSNETQYLRKITIDDVNDTDALDIAFDKKKADERKIWLTGE